MVEKNLLAVIKSRDKTHYLLRSFLKSLLKDTKKVFESLGYVGGLEYNVLTRFKKEDERHFTIFRAKEFKEFDDKYFSSTHQAALFEIPNVLQVKINFDSDEGGRHKYTYTGSIDKMISMYESLDHTDPKELLMKELMESEFFRANFTKKRFIRGGIGLSPTVFSIGLETNNGKFLLETTGILGPYAGTLTIVK